MKKGNLLTSEDFRILIALADGRGHPLWELQYMIMHEPPNSDTIITRKGRTEAFKAFMKINQGIKEGTLGLLKKDIEKSNDLKGILIKKNKGKLSERIDWLISNGWIVEETREKIKPQRGPKAPGPRSEHPLYIPEDRYKFIELILHDELKVLRKQIKLMETNILWMEDLDVLNKSRILDDFWSLSIPSPNDSTEYYIELFNMGQNKKVFLRLPRVDPSSPEYKKINSKFWNYAYLFMRWRHRVKMKDVNKSNQIPS